ncbi:J domain-containing protein [Hyphomicrobium sp. CS1BSMeth3]|uniref:J domain-containing protein n=1 Tax=Hyphomicrobium sp. CS1BSMeth3 TaxID=1892844 RepID=UPI000930748A|nr:J domain-containing protein [Hyphomicrobium sp. CS1BSMeth3]
MRTLVAAIVIVLFGGASVWRTITERIQERTPGYNWGEYGGFLIIAALLAALSVMLAPWLADWDQLPSHLVPIAALAGTVLWPVYAAARHKHRQDKLLDRIRAVFVLSTTNLTQERECQAREGLCLIRRLERRWRYGASYPYRLALMSSVILTNVGIALVYLIGTTHLNSQTHYHVQPLRETLRIHWESPFLWPLVIGFAVAFALPPSIEAFRITARQWSEFYGDRLEAILKAGRGVEAAPQHEGPELPPDGASALELLGLNPGFTKQELRKAWLRLARELHPDRWSASGAGVRSMKEAALKRVNAARDELAGLAR